MRDTAAQIQINPSTTIDPVILSYPLDLVRDVFSIRRDYLSILGRLQSLLPNENPFPSLREFYVHLNPTPHSCI